MRLLKSMTCVWTAILACGVLCAPTAASADAGELLGLQGRLLSAAGTPVPDGVYGMTVRFYAGEKDATKDAVYSYVDPGVQLSSGVFTVTIGDKQKLDGASFEAGKAGWIGVQVGNDPELPRTALRHVPYALRAKKALGLQCSGCIKGPHLDAAVLAPYAKTADLAVFAKDAELAKVAKSGSYADLSNKPTHVQLKTCPLGQVLTGYMADGTPVCVIDKNSDTTYTGKHFAVSGQSCPPGQYLSGIDGDGLKICAPDQNSGNTYTGKHFAVSNQSCGAGKVLRGFNADGLKICAGIGYEGKIPADAFTAGEVANLREAKLDDGTRPWTDGAQHNHVYDVNDPWLRDAGNNSHVKLHGNSRSMVFRTDGSSGYSNNGNYPFIWLLGGDTANFRKMMLDSSGNLWTATYGWLHTRFARANKSCPAGQYMYGTNSNGDPLCKVLPGAAGGMNRKFGYLTKAGSEVSGAFGKEGSIIVIDASSDMNGQLSYRCRRWTGNAVSCLELPSGSTVSHVWGANDATLFDKSKFRLAVKYNAGKPTVHLVVKANTFFNYQMMGHQ